MDPLLIMALLLVMVPLIVAAIVIVPPYLGMYGTLYWMYLPEEDGAPHPLAGQATHYSSIVQQYQKLLDFWRESPEAGFIELAVPLFTPPLLGGCVSLFLLWRFYCYVRGIFRVDNL